jgi:hypothetical protein
VVPSQVRDCPGTLVHELTGVQLKVESEQVVVQLVANSGVVVPRMTLIVTEDRNAVRVKSLRIWISFSLDEVTPGRRRRQEPGQSRLRSP